MSKIRAMFQPQKDLEVFYISDGIDASENWIPGTAYLHHSFQI